MRVFFDGVDLCCKLLAKEGGFLQVFALGLSFSAPNPSVSVWISRLGHRELCFLEISLSVPSEASRISGLVSKSATKKKQCSFFPGLGDMTEERDAMMDIKVVPSHGTAQAKGLGIEAEPAADFSGYRRMALGTGPIAY